jgi:putative FmdB family regulatory protein
MPVYDYDCMACGRRIEVAHGVFAAGPARCPNCGDGPLKKAIAAPAVHFKGSGWAKRDRRATVSPGTSKASADSESAAGGPKGDKEEATSSKESASSDRAAADAGAGEPSAAPSKTTVTGTATRTGS